MLERYGEAIHLDLRERGYLPFSLFQQRRFRLLTDLIDDLPISSRYYEALLNDEETMALIDDDEDEQKPGKSSVRIREWNPELQALASIADRLEMIYSVTVAANSKKGKGPKVKGYPRPDTAIKRAKFRKRIEQHEFLVSKLLPEGRE